MKLTAIGLRFKVILGLLFMVLLSAAAFQFVGGSAARIADGGELLQAVSRLEATADRLFSRTVIYKDNAPRDYDSYYRDLDVYYRDLKDDLSVLDATIASINGQVIALAEPAIPLGTAAAEADMAAAAQRLQAAWNQFADGLLEQLGEDLAEPRLEWGADFIIADEPQLAATIADTGRTIRSSMNELHRVLGQISDLALGALIVGAVLFSGWFSLSVVRRIRRAQRGIKRVANGDFGYQVEVSGADEVGELAADFNSLSARVRLVLSLLDRLQQAPDQRAALAAVFEESADYLGANSLVLASSARGDRLAVLGSPEVAANVMAGFEPGWDDSLVGDIIDAGRPLVVDHLRRHAVEKRNARLGREFLRRLGARSVMAIPLRAESGWIGTLVFGSDRRAGFRIDQAALLANLAPVIAHGLDQHDEAQVAPVSDLRLTA